MLVDSSGLLVVQRGRSATTDGGLRVTIRRAGSKERGEARVEVHSWNASICETVAFNPARAVGRRWQDTVREYCGLQAEELLERQEADIYRKGVSGGLGDRRWPWVGRA